MGGDEVGLRIEQPMGPALLRLSKLPTWHTVIAGLVGLGPHVSATRSRAHFSLHYPRRRWPTCRYYLSRKPRPSHALTATALTDVVAPPPLPPTKGNLHRHLHLPHHKRSLTGGPRRAGRGRRSGQNVLKRRPACLTLSLLQLAYAVDMWDQL